MNYEERLPHSRLRPFVHCYWTMAAAGPDGPIPPQRILPDGRVEIVLHFGEPFLRQREGQFACQPAAFVVTEIDRAFVIAPVGRVEIFGIRFRHGGASALLGGSMHDWLAESPALDVACGAYGREFAERIHAAGTFEARGLAADRLLLPRLDGTARDARLDVVLQTLQHGPLGVGVDAAAALVNLGRRHLERLVLRHVGIGPKRLQRLARFQSAARVLAAPRATPLATVALATGYANQAHLTRDFREFAGITPSAYRAETRSPLDPLGAEGQSN